MKLLKFTFLGFILITFFQIKSFSSDITTLLRNQQLTVFDIGILRLEEDLKKSYKAFEKHVDAPYEEIYIDVISSWWRNTVDLVISIPMKEGLVKSTYMSDSFRCKNIFSSVRDDLLKNQNMSNYRYTMATGYLTSIFTTPSHWPRWRYDQKTLDDLVNLVKLEVTLYPETKLAFQKDINPISCKGGLELNKDEIKITRKFN